MESTDNKLENAEWLFEELVVKQVSQNMQEALDIIGRGIAALNPNGTEEEIAKAIDSFVDEFRRLLPEVVVSYQNIIKDAIASIRKE